MSIKTTMDISREKAIERIKLISCLIKEKRYLELEIQTNEYDIDLKEWVDDFDEETDLANLHNYTNKDLEEIIDLPFYRYSMFENYIIIE